MLNRWIIVFIVCLQSGVAIAQLEFQKEATSSGEVFSIVEQMPKFPGGDDSLRKYVSTQLIYPEIARRDSVQGVVYITFVVDTTGDVMDVKILRGLSPECDAEALRVVSGMPDWIPGMQSGKKVKVRYNLPIRFRLN